MINKPRRRTLYGLGTLIALAFGSMAVLLAKYGLEFAPHVVFIVWAVLFLAAVMVFGRKN